MEETPTPAQEGPLLSFGIEARVLRAMSVFTAEAELRYNLCCVGCEASPTGLRLAATDGKVLGIAHLPNVVPGAGVTLDLGGVSEPASFLLPVRDFWPVLSHAGKMVVTVEVEGERITVSEPGGMSMRLPRGNLKGARFPDYRLVIPGPEVADCGSISVSSHLFSRFDKFAEAMGVPEGHRKMGLRIANSPNEYHPLGVFMPFLPWFYAVGMSMAAKPDDKCFSRPEWLMEGVQQKPEEPEAAEASVA